MGKKKLRLNRAMQIGMFVVAFVSCGPNSKTQENEKTSISSLNLIRSGASKMRRNIGDNQFQFTIMSADSDSESLVFGLPTQMINQPMLFGSIITSLSDSEDQELGMLKLANIAPIHVVPKVVTKSIGTKSLALIECENGCNVTQYAKTVIEIPITGVDEQNGLIYLDLSSLGQDLNIMAYRKYDPVLLEYRPTQSKAVMFDYSKSTLVFDVETSFAKKSGFHDSDATTFALTNRWFMKPLSTHDQSFEPRPPTPGVGFFLSESAGDEFIQYWNFKRADLRNGIKYYIKNVPVQFHKAFAGAFSEWNEKVSPLLNNRVFDFEFIPEGDRRNELIVAGDIRYNVLEWDLRNKAPYGGLGPSTANPYTGEILQSNVMIQGPAVVDIYSDWFSASQTSRELRVLGRNFEADSILARFYRGTVLKSKQGSRLQSLEVTLGNSLKMKIRSQERSLSDPLVSPFEIEELPAGSSFDTYMEGYFHDMVVHELGHNLGLRHNFKGNLGAKDGRPEVGTVSRSIMEYLGRRFRYLNRIGEYDLMAMRYGYKGISPNHTDWYCTDEDTASLDDPSNSAECSQEDATNDPFQYFLTQFERIASFLVGKGYQNAPEISSSEMSPALENVLIGLGSYAASSDQTADTWISFFGRGDRPVQTSDVKSYVLSKIKGVICNPQLSETVDSKYTSSDQNKTVLNLNTLRAITKQSLSSVYSPEELGCEL